jgi:pyridoxine 4-dehydrogenase
VRAVGERRPGSPPVIPIPGSTTVQRVEENAKCVELTEEEFSEVTALVENFETSGDRYPGYVRTNT